MFRIVYHYDGLEFIHRIPCGFFMKIETFDTVEAAEAKIAELKKTRSTLRITDWSVEKV